MRKYAHSIAYTVILFAMDILHAIILGVVQGITEFVPISSSGHLVIARDILGLHTPHALAFDVLLHFATACAVLVYFRRDIHEIVQSFFAKKEESSEQAKPRVLLWALVIGTIPAAFIGIFFEGLIEAHTRSVSVVIVTLLIGSLLFIAAEWWGRHRGELTAKKGLWIGLFQVLAFIPGFSRSGATISGGMLVGLSREAATRFAFLLSLPVLLGAGVLKGIELIRIGFPQSELVSLIVGGVVAFIVGLGALHFMIQFLKRHTLYVFVVYRVLLALVVFLFV